MWLSRKRLEEIKKASWAEGRSYGHREGYEAGCSERLNRLLARPLKSVMEAEEILRRRQEHGKGKL